MTENASPSYLDLLETRAKSKRRILRRAPICLDPEVYEQYIDAKEALHTVQKSAPAPRQGGQKPAQKLAAVDPVATAQKRVDTTGDKVREASINLVLEGKDADEIKDAQLAEGDRFGIILLALKGVEDMDGNPIPEIGPDKIVQLLPTLSSGELALIYTNITMASGAPDFPTSRRS